MGPLPPAGGPPPGGDSDGGRVGDGRPRVVTLTERPAAQRLPRQARTV